MKRDAWLAMVVATLAALAATARGAEAPGRGEIQRLIGALGAAKYAARETAQQQLLASGAADFQTVLDQSLRAYAATADPEVRYRLRAVMASLVGKHIFNRPRGFLGVQFNLAAGPMGAAAAVSPHFIAVVSVVPDGPAEKAGVKPGDQISAVDKLDLSRAPTTRTFLDYIQAHAPGDQVKLTIRRGEQTEPVAVTLGELPEEIRARLYTEDREEDFFKTWLQTQLDALFQK